jgi:hypothetical protein
MLFVGGTGRHPEGVVVVVTVAVEGLSSPLIMISATGAIL